MNLSKNTASAKYTYDETIFQTEKFVENKYNFSQNKIAAKRVSLSQKKYVNKPVSFVIKGSLETLHQTATPTDQLIVK